MRRLPVLFSASVLLLFAGDLAAQTTISSRAASIRFGGRLHSQYATSSVDADDSQFFFRRARLIADITVNDFFDARVQPEFAGGTAELKDAYVRFKFSPGFQVTVGQFKRAFDLFELASSTDLSLIERDGRVGGVSTCTGVGGVCSYSRFTEKLNFSDRDTGVRVAGGSGKVAYEVSLTNGTGANQDNDNDALSYSGRVSVEVAEGVTVSGQVAMHDYQDGADETAYAGAWGADVQVGDWRDGLLVQAAVVGGDNWKSLDSRGDPRTFMALQGAASYYAPLTGDRFVGVEPLVRLSYGDPDTSLDSDGGLVVTPGLMFYVMGKNKVGVNVDVWSPQTGDTEYSLKLQTFLYF
jgi:hypothetical protein